MAYKRRRLDDTSSSRPPSSHPPFSRPQVISRMSSVPRSTATSPSVIPALPQQRRISLRPTISNGGAPSPAGEDVVFGYDQEPDSEINAREDLDAMNEIIMAIDMKERGTVGCAYYVAREEKLCLVEDIKMAGLMLVDTLKLHAQPTVILISTRSEEKLEEHLIKDARGIERGDNASRFTSPSLETMPISHR